jgi:hypothetical protein
VIDNHSYNDTELITSVKMFYGTGPCFDLTQRKAQQIFLWLLALCFFLNGNSSYSPLEDSYIFCCVLKLVKKNFTLVSVLETFWNLSIYFNHLKFNGTARFCNILNYRGHLWKGLYISNGCVITISDTRPSNWLILWQ